MRERAKFLREKREIERQKLVNDKLDQQFRFEIYYRIDTT